LRATQIVSRTSIPCGWSMTSEGRLARGVEPTSRQALPSGDGSGKGPSGHRKSHRHVLQSGRTRGDSALTAAKIHRRTPTAGPPRTAAAPSFRQGTPTRSGPLGPPTRAATGQERGGGRAWREPLHHPKCSYAHRGVASRCRIYVDVGDNPPQDRRRQAGGGGVGRAEDLTRAAPQEFSTMNKSRSMRALRLRALRPRARQGRGFLVGKKDRTLPARAEVGEWREIG